MDNWIYCRKIIELILKKYEMKTKNELLEYVIQMREKGRSYGAVLNYLKLNCEKENHIQEIISDLNKLDRDGKINVKIEKDKEAFFNVNTIMGLLLILGGLVFYLFLETQGWISFLPFALMFIGFVAIFGNLKSFMSS